MCGFDWPVASTFVLCPCGPPISPFVTCYLTEHLRIQDPSCHFGCHAMPIQQQPFEFAVARFMPSSLLVPSQLLWTASQHTDIVDEF